VLHERVVGAEAHAQMMAKYADCGPTQGPVLAALQQQQQQQQHKDG
jgi:hypothetical protein